MNNTGVRFLAPKGQGDRHQTQIKICGMTSTQDALAAANSGVEAIGVIFYAPSPRNVESQLARQIVECMPESVSTVAVVVDPEDALISKIVSEVKPDFIQYHGSEPPQKCDEVGIPYIKTVRVRNTNQILETARSYPNAKALLLDTYESQRVGGTGIKFSWDLIPKVDQPVILAGGLNSKNVDQAITEVQPYAVDVSTGVERSPGIKEPAAIYKFVATVRSSTPTCKSKSKSSVVM